jgi:hypothetical protein
MPHRTGAANRHSLPWIGSALLLLVNGCQSTPKQPPATANQSVIESAKKAANPPESEAAPADPRNPETTVVVEKGADPAESPSSDLVRAARAERDRRSQSPPAGVVITNQTLAQQRPPAAKKRAATPTPAAAKGQAAPASDAPPGDGDENYWRNRGRDIRSRLRAEYENVDRLRRLTATMRERFYLTPQQLGRDEILWQEWGRLQESLSTAERGVDSTKKELTNFLEEGRVRGAHPGWLADGEEILLEYDRKKEEERQKPAPPAQATEPPVTSDSGGDRRR